jgi:uncharacterized protein
MKSTFAMWLTVGTLAVVPAGSAAELPTITLTIGTHKAIAEVATTPDQRSVGLMHRFSLKPDHGMLFVFERTEPLGFWMKNTFIALSIAFIGDDGRIINIEDMQPQTESNHCARKPARYALEMNQGWFAQRGIKPGTRLGGIDRAPRPQ